MDVLKRKQKGEAKQGSWTDEGCSSASTKDKGVNNNRPDAAISVLIG